MGKESSKDETILAAVIEILKARGKSVMSALIDQFVTKIAINTENF